jgi:hypothetical protein
VLSSGRRQIATAFRARTSPADRTTGDHLKHTVPTATVAAAAAAVVVVASAAAALPGVLATAAGADSSAPASGSPKVTEVAYRPEAAPTVYVFIPTPTPAPPTPAPTPKPKPRVVVIPDTVANAKIYARNRLGATQYACLDKIFTYESKWNPLAENPSSGAYGIPQALPGSKMAAFGSNWRTSPLTQVKWGIWYVEDRYGSACAAWDHIEATGWY